MANERARKLGYKYITDDKYLVNPFSPTEGISYEGDGSPVSYANSGIMAQAPIIYPPINQGSGGGNEPYIVPKDDDDDETYTGSSMSTKNAAKEVGKMFLMGGPQAYIMQKLISKGIGAFKDYRNKNKVEKYTGQEMSNYRDDRPSSEKNYTGGDTNSNPSTPGAQDSFSNKSGMGRTGYFFGGRVNYKAGGRTDAESQYGADSAGSYDSSQNQSGREQSYGGGNNTPVSNYDYSKLVDQYKEEPDYTLGNIELNKNLTNNTRLNTILNLQKTVEDKELAGQLELDKRLGPVDTRLTYGTDQKPKLSASYMNYSPTLGGIYANADSSDGLGVNYAYNGIGANANFDNSGKFERAGITYDNNGVALGLDTQDGVTASYSKDIFDGTGQIKAGGRYDPITGEYNAEGKISFPFANGGLAGLL
mgnify:CR=1 FL=1